MVHEHCTKAQSRARVKEVWESLVYTDASKSDGRIGAGFYTEYRYNFPKQAFFHLAIHCTVFQAEVLAISEIGKELFLEKMHNQRIVVLVDSQAAINHL